MSYVILEVANTHGGNKDYLKSLLDRYSEFNKIKKGIKFQIFSPEGICTTNHKNRKLFEKFYFDSSEWNEIISYSSDYDIWLDIFDNYSLEILTQNLDKIHGIKLQTSVLENYTVCQRLCELNLSNLEIALNIAGREIEDIKEILDFFKKKLNSKKIYLEVGFQNYPTKILDLGFSKIKEIKKHFDNDIILADHIDGSSDKSIWFPLLVFTLGVKIFEKHVMLNDKTKYDHYSSLLPEQFKDFCDNLYLVSQLSYQPLISDDEINYLNDTLMVPVLNQNVNKGDFFSLNNIDFKRSNTPGLTSKNLLNYIGSKNFLKWNKKKLNDSSVEIKDLKELKIGVIVVARMKSSRLKNKALLKINQTESLGWCIERCKAFAMVDTVILATSNLEEDQVLEKIAKNHSVEYFQGSAENVIIRNIEAAKLYGLDVIIRVTGDNPLVSPEVSEIILNDFIESGADYCAPKKFTLGTAVEIFTYKSLTDIYEKFKSGKHSEYLTWYYQNNQDYFNVKLTEIPKKFISDFRLTLDYQEDFDLINSMSEMINIQNPNYPLEKIISFLEKNKKISMINSLHNQVYKSDENLISVLNRETKINLSETNN